MSGEWIKMRRELLTSPKVVRIMSACKADRLRTIGGLFAVWCLFDEHTEDGVLPGYGPEVLDAMVGFPGISQAMIDAGWIEILKENKGLRAANFIEHNGRTAKRRAQESVRKMSARHADAKRTRSSSSSSSKNDIPDSVSSNGKSSVCKPEEVDLQHWNDWIAVRKAKRSGPVTATALKLLANEAGKVGISVAEAVKIAAGKGWTTFDANYSHGIEIVKGSRLPTEEERKTWRP